MCSMDVDTLPGNLKVAAVWILHLGFLSVVDMMAPMSGRMVMEFKARRNKIILKPMALKNLGDDINCRRCFEEALKRNGNDVEACINYSLFLYSRNDIPAAQKYYSQFQLLLNVLPKIDKELIAMGESLSKVLSSVSTHPGEGQENMNSENMTENPDEANEENSVIEGKEEKIMESKNSSLAVVSDENENEADDDLV
ncbi:hypothetical protein V9T40_002297 [Parthenolecanium corni]|uniref:Uncharacterized protein n=1 Tax=Parthenolecanium corni TaxID=536013 RepID=A0AAN9TKA1_9HEMI